MKNKNFKNILKAILTVCCCVIAAFLIWLYVGVIGDSSSLAIDFLKLI